MTDTLHPLSRSQAIRRVAAPLLLALTESRQAQQARDGGAKNPADVLAIEAKQFSALLEATLAVAGELNDGAGEAPNWDLLHAASQIVAGHYRANAAALSAEQIKPLSNLLQTLAEKYPQLVAASDKAGPATRTVFHARAIEALTPVVGCIAQYAFGRAEHLLVNEVAERLMKTADQLTRSLAPAGIAADDWRYLCWAVLRSAAQLYAESHYVEADRLLYMDVKEREAYFAKHGPQIPMDLIWQNFNQRMGMLATLAAYLELPGTAKDHHGLDWS